MGCQSLPNTSNISITTPQVQNRAPPRKQSRLKWALKCGRGSPDSTPQTHTHNQSSSCSSSPTQPKAHTGSSALSKTHNAAPPLQTGRTEGRVYYTHTLILYSISNTRIRGGDLEAPTYSKYSLDPGVSAASEEEMIARWKLAAVV